jgi:hypothetical protein
MPNHTTSRGPTQGWRKASASASNGQCVEIAQLPDGGVGVRDSKNPDGPVLHFTIREWTAFVDGVKKGEFDMRPTTE